MEDPADTGQVTGVYSMLYPVVGQWFFIDPDFDDKKLDFSGDIKGRIRIFTVLATALKLWFDKDFRYLKKEYEKL